MTTRAEREQIITDESDVYQQWHTLQKRYRHIFECPNTARAEGLIDDILKKEVSGKRVLEIGCGSGGNAEHLSSLGAAYVFAVDISHSRIAQAKRKEIPGVREYAGVDVSVPLQGVFDVIVGRAVLHHLDYQEVLLRLYSDNLSAKGMMLFYEPLGENWLIRAFHSFSKHAHTLDERPFEHCDLHWFRKAFHGFTLIPVNYLSLPFGAVSSFLFKTADNALLRGADAIDQFLARHVSFLHSHFRYAIFVIRRG